MRLIDADGDLISRQAVIKAVDKHTLDRSEIVLDEDITVILEEIPSVAIPTYTDMTNAEVFTQVFGTNLNRESVSKSWWEQKYKFNG